MSPRPVHALVLAAAVLLAACSSGPPSPPTLSYQAPRTSEVVYDYRSDAVIEVSLMGQSMQLSQEGTAELAVGFRDTSAGLGVTLAVQSMSATLRQPMGAPMQVDESSVDGSLVFSLDRVGNASVTSQPTIRPEASQMISGLGLANGFFPGLPGRAVVPGDRWVDTVSFEGNDGAGSGSENSVFEYTLRGDTVVAGRALLHIGVTGTTKSTSTMDVGGMSVRQASELNVDGHVLWDFQAGVMFESRKQGSGSGTVSVPIAPAPLPIIVETTEVARIRSSGA